MSAGHGKQLWPRCKESSKRWPGPHWIVVVVVEVVVAMVVDVLVVTEPVTVDVVVVVVGAKQKLSLPLHLHGAGMPLASSYSPPGTYCLHTFKNINNTIPCVQYTYTTAILELCVVVSINAFQD